MSNMPMNGVYRAVFKANIVMSQSFMEERYQLHKNDKSLTLEKVKISDKTNYKEAILTGSSTDIYNKVQEIITSIQ
ncbi:hypothetical protein AYY26_06240 [Photobacterium phosphoreum]|uniref:hypothetical protein n=1 Tax=Photobacterium phosphoreum TaxID=659 RepID=UPI0007F94F76|nr:hypothetical protein [Photobacterium phosphoreum]MCD9507358.1 hypothetical protein [Photobacterium phosphoreum]MCD9518376.1 hypothetical protein [Photobacterium phosphoreum]OBU41220.1 hypothetical protein AYY26_06240 [Photobacterium phosphoreum]PSU70054.1 hypothetical protein CTM79_09710 [Photobacterium phosphoreum]PSW10678.1 hypothetical protein C9J20_13535 [Photobacterium phosphoreum]